MHDGTSSHAAILLDGAGMQSKPVPLSPEPVDIQVEPVALSPEPLEDQDRVDLTENKMKENAQLQNFRDNIKKISQIENENVAKINAKKKTLAVGNRDPRQRAQRDRPPPSLTELLEGS